MQNLEIFLTVRPEEFKAIYFQGKNGNWVFNNTTKQSAFFLLMFILGASFFSFTHRYEKIAKPIYIMVFAFVLIDFLFKFYKYYRWRISVNDWIKEQSKYKKNRLEISTQHLLLEQDDEITIEKLDHIKSCEINREYIRISGNISFFFPKGSMTEEEYGLLIQTLKERIKNSATDEL